jgi:hypothetical protein
LLANLLDLPGTVFGLVSGLLGLYVIARGFGIHEYLDRTVERTRTALFTGRVRLITHVVAVVLLAIGGVGGVRALERCAPRPAGNSPSPRCSRQSCTARFILIAATIFVGGATQQGVQPLSTPIGLSGAVKNPSNQYQWHAAGPCEHARVCGRPVVGRAQHRDDLTVPE